MNNIEALKESYGLLEHLVCELMVIFSGILCVVGIRHTNFKISFVNFFYSPLASIGIQFK